MSLLIQIQPIKHFFGFNQLIIFYLYLFFLLHQHHQLSNHLINLSEAQIRLDLLNLSKNLLGILSLDGRVDDDLVTGDPVNWGGDLVLVAKLQGVDDAQDFGAIAAGRGGV